MGNGKVGVGAEESAVCLGKRSFNQQLLRGKGWKGMKQPAPLSCATRTPTVNYCNSWQPCVKAKGNGDAKKLDSVFPFCAAFFLLGSDAHAVKFNVSLKDIKINTLSCYESSHRSNNIGVRLRFIA